MNLMSSWIRENENSWSKFVANWPKLLNANLCRSIFLIIKIVLKDQSKSLRVPAGRKRERLSIQSQWWWTIRPKYINVLQQEYSTLSEFSFNPKSFLYYIKSPVIIDNNIWMGINVLENYFIREQIMQFSITNRLSSSDDEESRRFYSYCWIPMDLESANLCVFLAIWEVENH